jgi:hypothetical protein
VPVAPAAPGGGAITPAPGPGWGAPGVAPPAVARPPTLPPAPVILPRVPLPSVDGPYRSPRRSLADMANEQLRRGERKDALEQGMEGAARQDCARGGGKEGNVTGLLNAPSVIGRALRGECPK